jgi:hypothetical protein
MASCTSSSAAAVSPARMCSTAALFSSLAGSGAGTICASSAAAAASSCAAGPPLGQLCDAGIGADQCRAAVGVGERPPTAGECSDLWQQCTRV